MRHVTVPIGGPVHVADYGGQGRPIVLIHGLGGSYVNWTSVAEGLTAHGHVLAIDLIGFGYTPPRGRSSGVRENRQLLRRYLSSFAEPAVLVGNSMGGYLALTVAASSPELVAGLVLVGAALPRERLVPRDPMVAGVFGLYMVPGVARRFMELRNRRLGPEGLVRYTLRLCTVDESRISDEAWAAHLAMARERFEQPWTQDAFLEATRSLVPRLAGRRRVDQMVRDVGAPALIVHGGSDRLVPVDVAEHLARQRPDWQLEIIDDIGHVPQLEAPDRFLEVVGEWLVELEAGEVTAGR